MTEIQNRLPTPSIHRGSALALGWMERFKNLTISGRCTPFWTAFIGIKVESWGNTLSNSGKLTPPTKQEPN